MPRITPLQAAALLSLYSMPVTAMAQQPADEIQGGQDDDPEIRAIEADSKTTLTLRGTLGVNYQADADFDAGIGEIGLVEYNAGISAVVDPENAGQFSFTLGAGLLDYDITPSPTATPGDAASIGAGLDDIYTLKLLGIYSDRFDDKTGWFLGGGVSSSGEENADFGDSIDWMVTGGFEHRFNENLSLGIGVLVKSRLEDDVLIVPIPRIRYRIDDRWSIESQRAGLRVSYKSSDSFTYGISGEYQSQSFRLDDTHAMAPEGMGTHSRFPVVFFGDYSPNERVSVHATLGAALGGELEFLDRNGNDLSKQDIDPGIVGSVSVSFRF